jgi:DNA-directed RNA polymerase
LTEEQFSLTGNDIDINIDQELSEQNAHIAYLIEKQRGLEQRMLDRGAERFRERVIKNRELGKETSNGAGKKLLAGSLNHMITAVEEFVEAAGSTRGPKHIALRIFKELGPEATAYLTAKGIRDTITASSSATRVSLKIASFMLDELRYRKFRVEHKKLFEWRLENFKKIKSSSYAHMKRSMDATVLFAGLDTEEYQLSERDRVLIGTKALDLFQESTKYVEIRRTGSVSRQSTTVQAAEATMEWINQCNDDLEWLSPVCLPTVIPPRPWSSSRDGGYWFPGLKGKFPLMRTLSGRGSLEDIDNVDMPTVYTAINAMQDTSWRINEEVLRVVEILKVRGCEEAGLPSYTDEPEPVKPLWMAEAAEGRTPEEVAQGKEWRRKAHQVHDRNHLRKCEAIRFSKVMVACKIMLAETDEQGQPLAVLFPLQHGLQRSCVSDPGLPATAGRRSLSWSAHVWKGLALGNTGGR